MFKPVELISVFIGEAIVGRLALNTDSIAVFEYDKSWIENGFSISPLYLPLQSKTFISRREPFDGLFGVFNDSLPDGWGRLITDRFLKSKGVDPRVLTPLDRLSLTGCNGIGALSYKPENNIQSAVDSDDVEFLAREVSKILNSQSSDNLELLIAKNGSSAGVRPKVIVEHSGSKWLVKFPAQYDDENIGIIEYQCTLLAQKCGIQIPEVKLFKNRFFGAKLFDREKDNRFHVHSASGLLYANHRLPALDYTDLLKLTRILTNDMSEVEKMFKLMIFNVFIKNRDDHAKNFSFIYKNNKWEISPAYDLTPSFGFNGNHSTTISGQGNPEKVDIFKVAEDIGLNKKKYLSIYKEMEGIITEEKNKKPKLNNFFNTNL